MYHVCTNLPGRFTEDDNDDPQSMKAELRSNAIVISNSFTVVRMIPSDEMFWGAKKVKTLIIESSKSVCF